MSNAIGVPDGSAGRACGVSASTAELISFWTTGSTAAPCCRSLKREVAEEDGIAICFLLLLPFPNFIEDDPEVEAGDGIRRAPPDPELSSSSCLRIPFTAFLKLLGVALRADREDDNVNSGLLFVPCGLPWPQDNIFSSRGNVRLITCASLSEVTR